MNPSLCLGGAQEKIAQSAKKLEFWVGFGFDKAASAC